MKAITIKYLKKILVIFVFEIKIIYSSNLSLEEIHTAIKEVAYSYYMRGKNIQYNICKGGYFPPEDATSQNINHLVCTTFAFSVYRELLNITISMNPLNYSRDNLGCPEVIAYSKINTQTNNLEMSFYNSSSKNNITTKINPSINDIIPLLQIGDILSYSLHTFLIYDVIKDSEGNVIDAIIMESGYGSGRAWVNSKISESVELPNGNTFGTKNHFLFLNTYKNTEFEEGLEEGSLHLDFQHIDFGLL